MKTVPYSSSLRSENMPQHPSKTDFKNDIHNDFNSRTDFKIEL